MKKCILMSVIFIMCAFPLNAGVLDFYKTYTGKYVIGDETRAFYPEGSNEIWWVEGGEFGYDPSRQKCFKDVVFKGVASSKGHYGHLNQYDRALTVGKTVKYTEIECRDFDKVK